MPIFLTTLLASVRSIFQSRAALELEKPGSAPPNRGASEICGKTPEIDLRRPPVVDLPVPPLAHDRRRILHCRIASPGFDVLDGVGGRRQESAIGVPVAARLYLRKFANRAPQRLRRTLGALDR